MTSGRSRLQMSCASSGVHAEHNQRTFRQRGRQSGRLAHLETLAFAGERGRPPTIITPASGSGTVNRPEAIPRSMSSTAPGRRPRSVTRTWAPAFRTNWSPSSDSTAEDGRPAGSCGRRSGRVGKTGGCPLPKCGPSIQRLCYRGSEEPPWLRSGCKGPEADVCEVGDVLMPRVRTSARRQQVGRGRHQNSARARFSVDRRTGRFLPSQSSMPRISIRTDDTCHLLVECTSGSAVFGKALQSDDFIGSDDHISQTSVGGGNGDCGSPGARPTQRHT